MSRKTKMRELATLSDIVQIPLSDIKRPDHIDEVLASLLSTSIARIGLLHAIDVKRIPAMGEKYEIVAGRHRFRAVQLTGAKTVACRICRGDKDSRILIEVSENLHRKKLTVLESCELTAKYFAHYGEVDTEAASRTGGPGRPKGGISDFARRHPSLGVNEEACRKVISRRLKIAAISPKAKKIAVKLGLDDNQDALLKIANESDPDAQVRSARRLGNFRKRAGVKSKSKPKSKVNRTSASQPTLAKIRDLWEPQLENLWRFTQPSDREQFIEMLRTAAYETVSGKLLHLRRPKEGRPNSKDW